ncbi:MAG TPA: FkbM family methyltransferase [Thermoanaerobaculia bacterium]|nr:FkbM family methyltransferase [Thermoanaerobaculia bacterium]
MSLLKPHYLFRPVQALRRLAQPFRRPPAGPTVARLPWGLSLQVDPREDVGRAVWQLGLHDLTVCETLWRLTSSGDTAVDVGANVGQMTGLLALRAGPSGRVLAFEPHPDVFTDLTANVGLIAQARRAAPVETFRRALTAKAGTAWLDPGRDFATNHGLARLAQPGTGIPVEASTLDDMLDGRRAAVVKIDVEGHEPDVLRGAGEALRAGRIRHLLLEAGSSEERQSLAGLLAGYGYTFFVLGRTFFGLDLGAAGTAPHLPPYEAPSCLATLDPGEVRARLLPRGWRVLSAAARR